MSVIRVVLLIVQPHIYQKKIMIYQTTQIIRKQCEGKLITVLKKRGGGPVRSDHDHRFNGFCWTASLNKISKLNLLFSFPHGVN